MVTGRPGLSLFEYLHIQPWIRYVTLSDALQLHQPET